MGIRVTKHGGAHMWRLKTASGVCRSCLLATGKILPVRMKWECKVDGCKATYKSKHKHVV